MPKASSGARGQLGGVERLAVGIDREQRTVERLERLQSLEPADGHGVVQPGGAAQRVRMPGVMAAGGEHPGDVGGGGDANACAHVAQVARVLEQHHRRRAPVGEHGGGVDAAALGQRHHAGAGRERSELVEHARLDLAGEGVHARAQIGGELGGQAIQLGGGRGRPPRARSRRSAARA